MNKLVIDDKFSKLVDYYNYGKGINLPGIPDERRYSYSAICANIAWCLLNKDKFWEYYNKSDYWKVQLITACRQFGVKNYKPSIIGNPAIINKLLDRVYDYLSKEVGKSFYMRPHTLNSELCINTIFSILYEMECDLLYGSA